MQPWTRTRVCDRRNLSNEPAPRGAASAFVCASGEIKKTNSKE